MVQRRDYVSPETREAIAASDEVVALDYEAHHADLTEDLAAMAPEEGRRIRREDERFVSELDASAAARAELGSGVILGMHEVHDDVQRLINKRTD